MNIESSPTPGNFFAAQNELNTHDDEVLITVNQEHQSLVDVVLGQYYCDLIKNDFKNHETYFESATKMAQAKVITPQELQFLRQVHCAAQ